LTLPRILCVDDESRVLQGLQRLLYRDYQVVTAAGFEAAVACLDASEPFAVVMSDLRMPGMSGAVLLAEMRRRAPDTVRLLLSGEGELGATTLAANEGHIFRFLTKPCPPETLLRALADAVNQYRLITSEKLLLGQALAGDPTSPPAR
jgi:DNA-binding NtrC family response regulator